MKRGRIHVTLLLEIAKAKFGSVRRPGKALRR